MKFTKREDRPPKPSRRHYRFTILSGLVLIGAVLAAVAVPVLAGDTIDPNGVAAIAGAGILAGLLIALIPLWPIVLFAVVAAVGVVVSVAEFSVTTLAVSLGVLSMGIVLAPIFQVADHWEKGAVLRLGRFRRVFGPGPFVIAPLVDRVVRFTDMRIRVTDFSAERSITRDTVPVHVDALCFWLVWDAEKALLEIEQYVEAVTLSAQTALRDAIGRNDLATLLSERERLGSEIQTILEAKTNPWGVSILSIELKEVLVPKELEDALSRKAQAERERQSRVILSAAEVEIAAKFEEAAQTYEKNPTALQLRSMNMAYDSIRTNRNIVLLPSSALDTLNLGTSLGAAAMARARQEKTPIHLGEEPAPGNTDENVAPGDEGGTE